MTSRLALVLVALLLTGCSITKTVKPVSGVQITDLCVQHNTDILMDEFEPELRRQIEAKGVRTKVFSGEPLPECKYVLQYAANWRWDLAMFVWYINLKVMNNGALIGEATYDARYGGANLNKFGTTKAKLQPLVDELFAQAAQK